MLAGSCPARFLRPGPVCLGTVLLTVDQAFLQLPADEVPHLRLLLKLTRTTVPFFSLNWWFLLLNSAFIIHLFIPLCVSAFKSAHTCVHTHVEVRGQLEFSPSAIWVLGLGLQALGLVAVSFPHPHLPSVILPDSRPVPCSDHLKTFCFVWYKVPLTYFSQNCYHRYNKVFIHFSAFKMLYKDHTLKPCSPHILR